MIGHCDAVQKVIQAVAASVRGALALRAGAGVAHLGQPVQDQVTVAVGVQLWSDPFDHLVYQVPGRTQPGPVAGA